MSNPKEIPPLAERIAFWTERPETADMAVKAAQVMDAAQLDACLKIWEVLQSLSADADMLLASAAYLCPAMLSPDNKLKPEQARLLDGLNASRKVWEIYQQHGRMGSAEGLRRLLLAIIRDLRVVLILLARQLVQMRQAVAWPEPERLRAGATSPSTSMRRWPTGWASGS